jgi:SAM-dependent methyltransferase
MTTEPKSAESFGSTTRDSDLVSENPGLLEPSPSFQYMGSELELFAHATNWKSYVCSKLRLFLVGDVLEVGAGIGGTTQALNDGTQRRWVCLEPDAEFAKKIKSLPHLRNCDVLVGMLPDLEPQEKFDAILYIDVLEHIEEDREELILAAQHLKKDGVIVVLAPAFPWLYTPFDSAIGHYRRYTRRSLRAVAPQGLREEKCIYLDAFGVLASAGNLLFLQATKASPGQMRFWDNCLVPMSRVLDPLLAYSLGRSVLAIWRKTV